MGRKNLCRSCGFLLAIPGAAHRRAPATGERCECGALLVRVCRVAPGHEVVRCAAGCLAHDIQKIVQPCPYCGDDMLISASLVMGRYVYRCRSNHGHVKIEGSCEDPSGRRDERIFLHSYFKPD
jgi:hypothetical protein